MTDALLIFAARLLGKPVKLSAIDPITKTLERQEREARRKHLSTRHIQQARQARLHQALGGGL